jgi:multidrug efflux pump subunit AcrA (membrane-fusion protein)
MLAGIKQRHMRLIIDLVTNHTGDEDHWFVESRKSKDNPYRDYYIWRRQREGGHRKATLPTVILMVALGIFASSCNRGRATTATPTPEVEVATVEQRDVPVYSEWVATLDGYVNAQIRPQVSGYIIKQNYTEGSLVRKGQVLFEIDPRPFTAALDRAKGDLAQAEAQLGKSTLDVERDTPLAEARAIAKSQLDNEGSPQNSDNRAH